MKVELIPVIEITYYNQDIQLPDRSPFWVYPELWEIYNRQCYQQAGFKDIFLPYLPGFSFYRLKYISDNNLIKLTIDHTFEMRLGNYDRELASAFYGGYILRIDNEDKFFPQCCGDLSDIHFWNKLATTRVETFYNGHPEPAVKFAGNTITFDFSVPPSHEHFVPTPPDEKVSFDIDCLQKAIETVTIELSEFSERLLSINESEKLFIQDIDKLLVWGDD